MEVTYVNWIFTCVVSEFLRNGISSRVTCVSRYSCRMERVNDEGSVERIVTKFLLKTCRLCRQPSERAVWATCWCGVFAHEHRQDDKVVTIIPRLTGSEAEFYIEPMLPHIGDVDIMYYVNNELAISRGHPPPTQLPAEFGDYVQVFEIIDSLPGYVYLNRRYLLNKCTDRECYKVTANEHREIYFSSPKFEHDDVERHGPAHTARVDQRKKFPSILPVDLVHCVRCLSWPPQAADWPTRHRTYGWPDSATVDPVSYTHLTLPTKRIV